jgi:phospholipid/cholesterol/gamma-HCH transport system substrate-binding protein
MKRALISAVALAVTTTACTANGVSDINLPGGADLGSHPYHVTAQFRNALDLVRQSAVKVDNVAVGQVSDISLGGGGRYAVVTLEINGDVHLPANTTATIDQTSLLGEKYVALTRPADPTGILSNGATISLAATSQAVQIEQVLGALSLLLNGGGIGQLHDIVVELNHATGGRGAEIHSLLSNADRVIAAIDARRAGIIAALRQVNHLASTLQANNANISIALRDLPGGLKVLAGQRHQLVRMINALGRLGSTATATVRASRRSFVADLRALDPILKQLVRAGSDLPKSLQVLLTYPFPDSVLNAIRGDYLNTFVTNNLNTPGGTVVRIEKNPASLLPTRAGGH